MLVERLHPRVVRIVLAWREQNSNDGLMSMGIFRVARTSASVGLLALVACTSDGKTNDVQANPSDEWSVADEAGSASTDSVPTSVATQAPSDAVNEEMADAGANADETLGADPDDGSDEGRLEDSHGGGGADLDASTDATLPAADAANSGSGDPVGDPPTDPANPDASLDDSAADAGDVSSDSSDPPLCENERGSCYQEGDSVRCTCADGHEALDRLDECVPDICTYRLEAICPEPDAPCEPGALTVACFEQLSAQYDCSASAEHAGQTVVGGCTWSDEFDSYYCSCAFGESGTASGPVDGDCEEALQSLCFSPPSRDHCSVRSASPSGIPIKGTCNAVNEGASVFRCVCEWGECDDFSYTVADVLSDSCEQAVQLACSAEAQQIP